MRFAQPGSPAGGPDPGPDGSAGRRPSRGLRRRRARVVVAAAGAVVAGAAVTAVAATAGTPGHPQRAALAALARPRPARPPSLHVGPRAASARAARLKAMRSKAAQSQPAAEPRSRPEGKVIDTGIRDAAGELVLYVVKVDLRQLPDTHFGVMAGHRAPDGTLTAGVMVNETTGPATAPGFHAVESPISTGQPLVPFPEFGYYAGPAASITGRAGGHGRLLHAQTARWGLNHKIVIFWFPPRANPHHRQLTSLTARDSHGSPLPAGNNTPGVG